MHRSGVKGLQSPTHAGIGKVGIDENERIIKGDLKFGFHTVYIKVNIMF